MKNKKLIITNFGAIKHIDIDINRINIVIGKQSSGKSTIAKVLSFCQWAEKRCLIDGDFLYSVEKNFMNFHRIDKNYFMKDTNIIYETEFLKIGIFSPTQFTFQFKIKDEYIKYPRSINMYIPAERNLATSIPNIGKYNETYDNIMNFIYDWESIKRKFNKDLKILNLGFSFQFEEGKKDKDDTDFIKYTSNEKETKQRIPIRYSSSGMQSLVPLIVLFEYLTNVIYEKKQRTTPDEKNISLLFNESIDDNTKSKLGGILYKNILSEEKQDLQKIIAMLAYNQDYSYSNIIIEEAELNLFPETQVELINYFLEVFNNSERDHTLFLTTHSPFIINSLNNNMLGFQIKDHILKSKKKSYSNNRSWIDPDMVSLWQLERGKLISIKNSETKTIDEHFFSSISKNQTYQFINMLHDKL